LLGNDQVVEAPPIRRLRLVRYRRPNTAPDGRAALRQPGLRQGKAPGCRRDTRTESAEAKARQSEPESGQARSASRPERRNLVDRSRPDST